MSITQQQSDDWADDLARTIISDNMLLPPREARMLLAERLRVVKSEGHIEGINETADVVFAAFARASGVLQ